MDACMNAGTFESSQTGISKDVDSHSKQTLRPGTAGGPAMTTIGPPPPAVLVVSKCAESSGNEHLNSLTTPARYSSVSTTASSAFGTRPPGHNASYSPNRDSDEENDVLPDWTKALYSSDNRSLPPFIQENGSSDSSDLLKTPSPAHSRSPAPTLSISTSTSTPSTNSSPPFFKYSVCGALSPFDRLRQGSIASTAISPNTSRENFSLHQPPFNNGPRKDGFPDFDASFPANPHGNNMPELMIHDMDQIAPLSPGLSAFKSCGSSVAARSTNSSARNSRTVSFAPTTETLEFASSFKHPKPRANAPPPKVSISVGELENEFGRDPTRAGAYSRTILMYLVVLNPVICFANALFTIALLAYLMLTYPFYLVSLPFRRSSTPTIDLTSTVDCTTSTASTTSSNISKPYQQHQQPKPPARTLSGHFSPSINYHLSTLLFLHIRIIYQTSRPAPPPPDWKTRRLVAVHLLSPLYSVAPYGVLAWAAAAWWALALLRNRAAAEDEEARSHRGGYIWDWEAGRQEREFWALRRVRKMWEAVLLTTLH